jgi:hypothetical protein
MPMPNTYSFTKSDFAAMLQHIVDLIPDWMFLYDPASDMIVYHNQKNGWMFGSDAAASGADPVRLRDLLGDLVLAEDRPILDDNARKLQGLEGPSIREIRFRIRASDRRRGYRWCAFRQKLFWQEEGRGVKFILCFCTEVRQQATRRVDEGFCYS